MIVDKTLKRIINEVKRKYNLTDEQVIEIFESQFDFIRTMIEKIEFKEVKSEEELSKIKTNFNVPGLFKLYANKKILLKLNKKEENGE